VLGRCAMCHATEPSYEGIYHAPKGVVLDSDAAITAHARDIYLQAGRSHAMPPANVTQMSDKERQLLVTWFEETGKENAARCPIFSCAAARFPSAAGPKASATLHPIAMRTMVGC